MSNTMSEQEDKQVFNEWNFTVWSDSRDWCRQCSKEKNKLIFDDQTKTTKCTQCGHVETYTDRDWAILQAKRYVTHHYMPGKYYFAHLSKEEIFQKYLREYNHNDWSSWLIHDYVLAKMKDDRTVQDKLLETAKLVVEKMNYDSTTWKNLFEKMNAKDPEMFHQVPQILYEVVEKKFQETASKEEFTAMLEGYAATLTSVYSYSRWKGDRVACWVSSEIIKLCNTDEGYSIGFYTDLFGCDPLLEGFQDELIAGKKRDISVKDTYIQWQLNLADKFLQQSSVLVATQAAYEALTAKLGIHALWPPTKILPFDIKTVEKVTTLVNEPELLRFYTTALNLDTIDPAKACYYAKQFIEKIKKMLPEITPIEQEQKKQAAYIT
ncbi:hypothetical protein [Candidatus Bathycorpusculum sp.]|uniref:hypothetical protein n=1 Tax=Candidatus Bathycorpusculum sp. TaxID=2994959 RepID=UPI00282FF814|nr:hypothetical protein [Candidatus Termitimicrobium sp.]MCL2686886.1 hypothetical protein [Candidatus Termitimicrobium sp.]